MMKIKHVQAEENTVEVFENDIDLFISEFQELQEIDNLRNVSQSVWNACMMYVGKNVFKGTGKLKSRQLSHIDGLYGSTNFNAYDYDKVNQVCDHYIYLCGLYDKEVSVIGFSKLTGIDQDTIYQWGHGKRLSDVSLIVYKKLYTEREESLSNKLVTGKQNPVGVLGVLNRHYQWNMPGVRDQGGSKVTLTAAELPKLGQNPSLLSDNSASNQQE